MCVGGVLLGALFFPFLFVCLFCNVIVGLDICIHDGRVNAIIYMEIGRRGRVDN